MAKHVLSDAGIYFAGFNISGDLNQCQLQLDVDPVEVTVFGDAAHNFVPGLKTSVFSASGFYDSPADSTVAGNLATTNDILIASGQPAVGAVAYMMKALMSQYTLGGQIGDAFPFDFACAARDQAFRGQLEILSSLSATGASTGVQLGALASTQRLWAAAMTTGLPTGSSPTLTLKVQSDDNSGFTSATDRITMTQFTGRGQAMNSVDGAITDDYWRFSYTLGGSTPVFPIVAAFGIVTI